MKNIYSYKNSDARHSLDFNRGPPVANIANLKEKLRKNANVKKWKGRREKQFGSNIIKDQNYNSPDTIVPINTRYGIKNTGFMRQRTEDSNFVVKKEYFNSNIPRNKSLINDHYVKKNNIRKVYQTIDYEAGRNRPNQLKKKKFGTNTGSNSSSNNSLTKSNKYIISNDFIFTSNQYMRSNNNFDTSLSVNEPFNNKSKPVNSGIVSGLSNMKRRKKQQEFASNNIPSFGSSFRTSNERFPENPAHNRDYIKTRYNSFKNSPLIGTTKAPGIVDGNLATLYRDKSKGMGENWQNSSINSTSMGAIKKNRSRDGLIQQNIRQNLQLKLKKRIFNDPKKSIGETRREINMPTLNSQNRRNQHEKYSILKQSNDESLNKSDNRPVDKANTSLDTYHTKSFEDVIKSSSSIMLKNLQKNKPQPANYNMNKKILAALANSKFKESAPNIRKPKNEVIVVEENSVDATDAYSYANETKKGSTKVRTQESTTDQVDEIQTQGTIYDKIQAETHHSLTKPQKQNSFTNNTSEDLINDEEKLYGSEGLVNEYNENLDQDFESPIEYKAISPSPHPNTSAMSKEVGLDDRTS